MTEFNGWTLYDKVGIVLCNKRGTMTQGYVVDPKNKKQINTAMKWARCYDKENNTVIDGELRVFDNKGFHIQLCESARSSAEGGKVSFWNCVITHNDSDLNCLIGIDSELLLHLLMYNTFVNGHCDAEMSFARKNGAVGLLSYNMPDYQLAVKDMLTKKDVRTKVTSKWQIGCRYDTVTLSDIYFGRLVAPLELSTNFRTKHQINFAQNMYKYCTLKSNLRDYDGLTKISEVIAKWDTILSETIENIKINENGLYINKYLSDLQYYIPLFHTMSFNNKLPSRKNSGVVFEVDIDFEKEVNKFIERVMNSLCDVLEDRITNNVWILDRLTQLFIRYGENVSFDFDNPDLTETEKRFLKLMVQYRDKIAYTDNIDLSNIMKILELLE